MRDQTPPSGDAELRYWEAPEYREKYSDDDRKALAKKGIGHAMPDGSYPTDDRADVEKAVKAVGRGGADHDAIRKHVMAAAKRLGCADLIPDTWQADGSLKQTNAALVKGRERRRKDRHRALALLPEVRYFDPKRVEIRAEGGDSGQFLLTGQPIMYGAEYRVIDPWGEFVERIHFGSATDILDRGVDCRLLLNHDGLPMARTLSGTMNLWDAPESLHFKANLDARQQLANDFYLAISRRDIDQMSVGMLVGNDEWGTEGRSETRDIYALSDLLDVSGVTYPCSPTTGIEVAQRMAMQRPVESRARLRRLVANAAAGQRLDKDDIAALRSMVTPDLDPGDETQTPEGTGRLGNPDGTGETWANEGDLELPDTVSADGTEGGDTSDYATAPPEDGTGTRSASPSRMTRIRVQRALRGL